MQRRTRTRSRVASHAAWGSVVTLFLPSRHEHLKPRARQSRRGTAGLGRPCLHRGRPKPTILIAAALDAHHDHETKSAPNQIGQRSLESRVSSPHRRHVSWTSLFCPP